MNAEDRTLDTTTGASVADQDLVQQYEIRVDGRLSPRWSAWFDGLVVEPQGHGTTVIRGAVADQAALHGLLQKLRDVGIPLLSLTRIHTNTTEPTAHPNKEH